MGAPWKKAYAGTEGTGTGAGFSYWTEGINQMPTARQVAELQRTHGSTACEERWWFLKPDTLKKMASAGRREMAAEAA